MTRIWKASLALAAISFAFFLLMIPAAIIAISAGGGQQGSNPNGVSAPVGISDEVPEQYRAAVLRAGSVCEGITPPLIAAQIETESAWRADATSNAGAMGIAQFMPATWAAHGLDGDGDGAADPWNPTDAIYSQGAFMCHLLAQVDAGLAAHAINGDRVELALAAYNAGYGAVEAAGGIPQNNETRQYAPRIMSAISAYTGNSVNDSGPAAPGSGTTAAIAWAQGIADDDAHGYVWGGEGPQHYDCSGLTQAFMRMRGIELPHNANEQSLLGAEVLEMSAQPGDLIFWSSGGRAFHTAIYTGWGNMISADSPEQGINAEPIWGRGKYTITFRRYTE